MKKYVLILMIFPFFLNSCGLFLKSKNNKLKVWKETAEYPDIKGYKKHILFLEKNPIEQDTAFLVEVFVGKEMLVDCNFHSLIGKFVEKKAKRNNKTYHLFESDGRTTSTQMLCKTNRKSKRFIAQRLMLRYQDKPLIIYAPPKMEVRYRLWKPQDLEQFFQKNTTLDAEAKKKLDYFPQTIENWIRTISYLPKLKNQAEEKKYKVEIIPFETCRLDCSTYKLLGRYKQEFVSGMGFPYYIFFGMQGTVLTEKYNCKERKTEKVIEAKGKLLDYNSKLPIVTFIPNKLNLKSKIWVTDEVFHKAKLSLNSGKKQQITATEYAKMEDDIWLQFLENATQMEIYQSVLTSDFNVNSVLYRWIKDNPKVDKATILMAYWKALPTANNKKYTDREEFIKRRGKEEVGIYDFIEEVEKKYVAGFYKGNEIIFNPKDDVNHRDWTDEVSERGLVFVVSRSTPSVMFRPTKGTVEVKELPKNYENGLPKKYAEKIDKIFDKYQVK